MLVLQAFTLSQGLVSAHPVPLEPSQILMELILLLYAKAVLLALTHLLQAPLHVFHAPQVPTHRL
jgi:hypothetical protein